MTEEIALEQAPDLRRIYATALRRRGSTSETLPDVRYSRAGIRVDVDDLVAYARACRFPVGGSLPATYPHLVAFPLQMAVMSGDGFPLPLLGAVHVENRIEVVRPITPEDRLDVSVWAAGLRPQ